MKLPFKDGNLLDKFQLKLSNKELKKLDEISNVYELSFSENYNSQQEASCVVYKTLDNEECNVWDKLTDFAIVYLKETATYYEIRITVEETDTLKKTLTLTSLCEAELSTIMLYDIEINTDDDIDREDYTIPSVLYRENNPKASILNRLLDKAPHYHIGHVDTSLKNIQRSFSFDNKSIYDALMEIAEEIKCLFIFDTATRTINCYDLLSYCLDCGNREDMDDICPKCESNNIVKPYGIDTGIYIDVNNLAEQITVDEDSDNVFNTLKLKAGDELMTATIRSLNPNGTDYLYYFNQQTLDSMPKSLSEKLLSYNELVDDYSKNYLLNITDDSLISNYNALVSKYNGSAYAQYQYNEDNEKVLTNNSFLPIDKTKKGYSNLTSLYFDVVDFNLYLESSLMPTTIKEAQSAKEDIINLTDDNLSPLALSELKFSTNQTTVENAIKAFSRIFTYATYKITVTTSSWDYIGDDGDTGFHYGEWIGTITLQSYSDETDNATTDVLRITVTDNYEKFLSQKIRKQIISSNESLGGIYDLISIDISEDLTKFKNAIKYYSLERLNSFHDAYRSALDSLIEVDQASEQADFYNALYVPYYNRWTAIDEELGTRKAEIDLITNISDIIDGLKVEIQEALDFKKYLGDDNWTVFCSYRRESVYENSNYISTGLSNAELIGNANKFMDVAKKESIEAGTPQITLSISMSNIFARKEFGKLIDNFTVGNWIRCKCNGYLYKLRLTKIQIDTESLDNCGVEFSSLRKRYNCLSDTQSILDNAKNISNSYSYVSSQVDKSKKATTIVENWFERGLDATMKIYNDANNQKVSFDMNGLLVRSYDDIDNVFDDHQLKMINAGIAITNDNWKTVKTALGKYYFTDPETGENKIAYGLNAETLIGNLIISKTLKLYSKNGYNSSIFDDNGWDIVTRPVDGKYSDKIFSISKLETDGNKKKLFYLNNDGELIINTSQINMIAEKANKVQDAIDLAGEGVIKTELEYYLSTSETQLLGGSWSITSPTWKEGYYVWVRTKMYYKNGTEPSYSNPSCISGAQGKNGIGIKSITAQYAKSTSNVTAPTTGWQDTCPTVEEKTYIWTRSHIEWDDGTSSNTVPTLSTLAKGLSDAIASIKINTNNIESKVSKTDYTGTTISSLINQDANTILIKASKIDLVGQVTFKSFDKDVQNKLSNATENSSNALNKANEANNNSSSALDKVTELENKANNGDFDGRGVESTKIEYKVTDDGITTPSNEGWSTTFPVVSEDDYLWTRTTITYTSGDPSVIYSVSHMAVNGDSIIVKSIVVTYGTSKNPNIKPTNFSTDIPVASPGEYLWCKTVTTYSDGKSVETYSYALQGNDGDSPTVSISKKDNITTITIKNPDGTVTTKEIYDGNAGTPGKNGDTSYFHVKYSNDAGKTFTSQDGEVIGEYIGTYVDFKSEDSLEVTNYTWAKIKGENGDKGEDGTSVFVRLTKTTYGTSTSASIKPTSWSTTIPTSLEQGTYLWTKMYIEYTDGKTIESYSYTVQGRDGKTGKGVKSITAHYLISDQNTGIKISTSGWQDTPQIPTTTQKYHWCYQTITYTTDEVENTNPCIIGVYGDTGLKGDTGKGIKSTVTKYYLSNSNTELKGSYWSNIPLTWSYGKYYWTKEYITWTDNTSTSTDAVLANGLNDSLIASYNAEKAANDAAQKAYESEQKIAAWCDENDTTKIDGSKIYTGTVSTIQLNANSVTAEKLAVDAIKSRNYIKNNSGSYLSLKDGTFDSKYFKWDETGKINATSGEIGGWLLDSKKIYKISSEVIDESQNAVTTYSIELSTIPNESGSDTGGSMYLASKQVTTADTYITNSNPMGYRIVSGAELSNGSISNQYKIYDKTAGLQTTFTTSINTGSLLFDTMYNSTQHLADISLSPYQGGYFRIETSTAAMMISSKEDLTIQTTDGNLFLTGGGKDHLVYASKPDTGSHEVVTSWNYGHHMYLDWTGSSVFCRVDATNFTLSHSSDRRLKDDINELDEKLINTYMSLKPSSYVFKDDGAYHKDGHEFGLIAQDIIKAFTDNNLDFNDYTLVNVENTLDNKQKEILGGDDHYYSVDYDNLHALHILVNKNQEKRIQILENEIENLKKELKEINGK